MDQEVFAKVVGTFWGAEAVFAIPLRVNFVAEEVFVKVVGTFWGAEGDVGRFAKGIWAGEGGASKSGWHLLER